MVHFFATHPTASNLMMLLFILMGLLTLPNIKRETFPEINSFEVQVTAVYPGATPLDVEQSICKPLEDAFDGISFIEEKRCQALNSSGVMTVKMLEHGDFNKFQDDIKRAVDSIDSFPEAVELPTVEEFGRTNEVVTVAVTANIPRPALKTLAEDLKQRMLQHGGIPLVEIQGFSKRQFQIQVPQHNLRQYGLSLQEIAKLVAAQNLDMPLGDVTTDYRDYQIRFSDERRSVRELEQLVVLRGAQGNEVQLGDIATVIDTFEQEENKVFYNGKPAALLKVKKNKRDDSLNVLNSVQDLIEKQQARLPPGIEFHLSQDFTSIVKDRIQMLLRNAWQGLLLVFIVMWMFFGTRYAFWVVMGLPVSFLASAFVLANMGISINMLSMVALLLALGILMDDAIVISESIGSQIRHGHKPLEAAINGTRIVTRGVISSFLTTLCIFTGLIFLEGHIGQVLKVVPMVLISVIAVSLFEAFFILPHHLYHSLSSNTDKFGIGLRQKIDRRFEQSRLKMDQWVAQLIQRRYAFIGGVLGFFVFTIALLISGVVKFAPFPTLEGDVLQARILMPAGTSLKQTELVVAQIVNALEETDAELSQRNNEELIRAITVTHNQNADAFETGAHLATITADLLTADQRTTSMNELTALWREKTGTIPEALNISLKEPTIGPAGRAIEIRLLGDDLDRLSKASHELQQWLAGYPGVNNLMDDLRPGKPEFTLHMKGGAFALGLDARTIADQLRSAYQGSKVVETSVDLETYEVSVILDETSRDSLADFDDFPIIHPVSGNVFPLSTVAEISPSRSYSRIQRINNQRVVTVYGDIDANINNTNAVIGDVRKQFLTSFKQQYPDISIGLEGEIKRGKVTQNSMRTAFILGLFGVFVLLSFQFRSYLEPLVVIVTIPLALIGVIWGHLIMGLEITLPSMLGFVSLSGIVVNDSILLVEFVKRRVREGFNVHEAAAKASHDRYRAVLLTSLTTIAGLTPLLFETSLQAQIIIPLATSIVFGILSSTLLVLFVVPCLYTILEDFGLSKAMEQSTAITED